MKIFYLVCLFTFIFSNSQVGINTESPSTTLDINGDLTIRRTPEIDTENAQQLYIKTDGLVGIIKKSEVSTKFFNAKTERDVISNKSDDYNNSTIITFPFVNNDIIINNIGISINSDGTFKIGETGVYNINSFMNLSITIQSGASNNMVYPLAKIQKKVVGGTNWEDITSNRPVQTIVLSNQILSIPLPTTVESLNSGDLIRFIVYKSNSFGGNLSSFIIKSLYNISTFELSMTKL